MKKIAYGYIEKADNLAEKIDFTDEQIDLYLLLSTMYQEKNQFKKALIAQQKYLALYRKLQKSHIVNHDQQIKESRNNRNISLKLAEQSDLRSQFIDKYQQQKELIGFSFTGLIVFSLVILFLILKLRALKLNRAYDEVEKPLDFIASPVQTKKNYQLQFKMSRKYQYRLAVGYISVDNWKELSFHFNKRTINEVAKTIATLVNKYSNEFDQVGLIHDGEYLLLCPHQTLEEIVTKYTQLTEALNVCFFANLGDFVVKISYAYQIPAVQDIDPYIFLSRLSESTKQK